MLELVLLCAILALVGVPLHDRSEAASQDLIVVLHSIQIPLRADHLLSDLLLLHLLSLELLLALRIGEVLHHLDDVIALSRIVRLGGHAFDEDAGQLVGVNFAVIRCMKRRSSRRWLLLVDRLRINILHCALGQPDLIVRALNLVAVGALICRLHIEVLLTVELGTSALGWLLWLMLVRSLRCEGLLACCSAASVHLVYHLASTGHPLAEETSSLD